MTDRFLDAVVFALAAHRATRLVTKDTITAKLRDRIVARAYGNPRVSSRGGFIEGDPDGDRAWTPDGGWSLYAEQDSDAPLLAVLLTCRWCAGVHVTFWLLLAAAVAPRPARWLRYLLAGSSAAVLLARIEE